MMYNVYAIKSEKDKRIYVGMSADVEKRIRQYNSGQVFSTKSYRPWKLIYTEKVGDRIECRKKEKYYKSGFGKEFLKNL